MLTVAMMVGVRVEWLLLLPYSLGIRVLSSGRDLATHQPHHSGAELFHSALAGHDAVTLCARFMSYQFTHHRYTTPKIVLLRTDVDLINAYTMSAENRFAQLYAGEQWQAGDVLLWGAFGSLWNSVCMLLHASRNVCKVIINGTKPAKPRTETE